MRIDIISVVPDLLISPFQHSILKRAQENNLLEVVVHNLREFTTYRHKQVDDYQYGGGAGMVLMIEPIDNCINALKEKRNYDEVIYTSPDGELFSQSKAIREHLITLEISIGNYVLSGGELAAAVITDAIGRLIPGVLNEETSALTDSFQDDLIAPPVFTRPEDYKGWKVPEILLSGHEKNINDWRYEKSLERTKERRPNLLK
jgi:tRNA (guanine37-N1)-methyltransferase